MERIERISGDINLEVKMDFKAILLLGGVVYFSARQAVRRELKRGRSGGTFYNTVVQPAVTDAADRVERAFKGEEENAAKIEEAKRLRDQGHSILHIAQKLDTPESTIRRWFKTPKSPGNGDIPRQPNGE